MSKPGKNSTGEMDYRGLIMGQNLNLDEIKKLIEISQTNKLNKEKR